MKVIKAEIRFKTGFQQPKTGFPKNPVLTSLNLALTDPRNMDLIRKYGIEIAI